MYDDKVPMRLRELQQWFGGVVGRPLGNGGALSYADADEYLLASPTLEPWQRIELYNKQYWYRLIDVYQENFPLLVRLFGYDDFNVSLVIPCLAERPPDHWSLDLIGQQLVDWIERSYHAKDRALVLDAARVDFAVTSAFSAADLPLLVEPSLDTRLCLQPHVHLLKLSRNLLQFRDQVLSQPPEHWYDAPFPETAAGECFAIYRTRQQKVQWRELAKAEYRLLALIQAGASLAEACDHLEQNEPLLVTEALEHLQHWCHEWLSSGILARSS